jgi:hypothetical protein
MKNEFSKTMKDQIDFYETNYVPAPIHLNFTEKRYLGNNHDKVCRFCGLKNPDTTFRTEAHALPELIGNKVLISNYECDKCNEKFSRTVEDHFAKYTGLSRTMSQISGKKGVPSFKSKDKKSRIDFEKDMISIRSSIDNEIATINDEKKQLTIHGYRQPYNPRSVYKCLVKMALSIMPEVEMINFKDTVSWLNMENAEDDKIKTDSLVCFHSFTPGGHPFPWITVILLRRKRDDLLLPYMSFFIAFSNYTFQIFIPFSQRDSHILNQKIRLVFFPNIHHDTAKYGDVNYRLLNFSKNEIVESEKSEMVMHFDKKIKLYP